MSFNQEMELDFKMFARFPLPGVVLFINAKGPHEYGFNNGALISWHGFAIAAPYGGKYKIPEINKTCLHIMPQLDVTGRQVHRSSCVLQHNQCHSQAL